MFVRVMRKRERKERKMTTLNTSNNTNAEKTKMIACVSGLADLASFFVLDSDNDDPLQPRTSTCIQLALPSCIVTST